MLNYNWKVQIFKNKDFGKIRVIGDPNNPLFCASDVCLALGYKNGRDTITRIFQGGVAKYYTPTNSGIQEMTYLTESQLYKLILRSNAKNAEPFQDWQGISTTHL